MGSVRQHPTCDQLFQIHGDNNTFYPMINQEKTSEKFAKNVRNVRGTVSENSQRVQSGVYR